MSAIPKLFWIHDQPAHGSAIEYTARLLSNLIGVRAATLPIGDSHGDFEGPVVWYSQKPAPSRASVLRIRPQARFWDIVANRAGVTPRTAIDWYRTVLPTWDDSPDPADPIAATFFLVSRIEEIADRVRDKHDRFIAGHAWMVQAGLSERPLVHEYAETISRLLGLESEQLSPWPGGKRFAIAFTHDIDRWRMHGPLWQDIRSTLGGLRFPGGWGAALRRWQSRRAVRAGRTRDPYGTIEHIAELHEQHNQRATLFWINAPISIRDADYAERDPQVVNTAQSLAARGFENGLHGSYSSYNDAEALRQQGTSLQEALGTPVRATRQHYLRLRVPDTFQAQRDAGLTVDSSLGFAECPGFRAGIAVPFHPWSFEKNAPLPIWELPLIMMDVSLREYMRLTPAKAIERSRTILERMSQTGGAAAVLWHNSALNNINWRGWDSVYGQWLSMSQDLNGWGATISEIVNVWQTYVGLLDQ
jgi:hypothetical protein